MKLLCRMTACVALLLAGAGFARAETLTFTGAGGDIPQSSGGTPGVLTSDIVVSESLAITDVTVTLLGLTHTWVGDLIASLTHVDSGTTVDLFNRIDRTGNSGVGDASDFNGDYAFNDAFTGDLWAAAKGGGNNFDIPGGDYFATTVEGSVSLLSAFNGVLAAGTWRLSISDNADGDSGSLGSWQLRLTAIPEPSSIVLVGLASVVGVGVGLHRRRRPHAPAR
ncbi:proprotein convertase P-domain-containing protein [Tautonia rosea]|uniref:proprotein convertase P-domain-containing protein n=1 Tax=Tautonia rosea TaxID=2728037 RepID=UPI001474240F|nr:proprotein convertase P-domain-containing protein [Tautonia rosea]